MEQRPLSQFPCVWDTFSTMSHGLQPKSVQWYTLVACGLVHPSLTKDINVDWYQECSAEFRNAGTCLLGILQYKDVYGSGHNPGQKELQLRKLDLHLHLRCKEDLKSSKVLFCH